MPISWKYYIFILHNLQYYQLKAYFTFWGKAGFKCYIFFVVFNFEFIFFPKFPLLPHFQPHKTFKVLPSKISFFFFCLSPSFFFSFLFQNLERKYVDISEVDKKLQLYWHKTFCYKMKEIEGGWLRVFLLYFIINLSRFYVPKFMVILKTSFLVSESELVTSRENFTSHLSSRNFDDQLEHDRSSIVNIVTQPFNKEKQAKKKIMKCPASSLNYQFYQLSDCCL